MLSHVSFLHILPVHNSYSLPCLHIQTYFLPNSQPTEFHPNTSHSQRMRQPLPVSQISVCNVISLHPLICSG